MTNINANQHGACKKLSTELQVEEVSTQLRINLTKDI